MNNIAANLHPDNLLNFGTRHSLPCILQTEAAECGLACLAMINGFYGHDIDLSSLRSRFSISLQGATLQQIIKIADKMDLSTRALQLDLEQLIQLQTPCILHWEMKHFVVLKKVTSQYIIVHDPALGERKYTMSEVDNRFTGVALELTPTPEFQPGKQRKSLSFSHFWSRIVGLRRSLIVVLVLSLLLQVFAVIHPYYIQTVVDDVILRSDLDLLTVLAIGFGLLLVLDTGTTYLRQMVILNVSSRMNIQLSINVFTHLIRLPMDYFSKRHMGDIVSRFSSLQSIREMLTTGLVTAFVDGLMALITLTIMFFYDVTLTWIVIIVAFLYALLRFMFYAPVRRLSEESIVSAAKENTHFMESVRAIQTIKMFEKESDRQTQWHNNLADAMNKDIRLAKWDIGFNTANKVLFGTENILVIYFAALAVSNNLFTVGMLFAFISFKTRFIKAMDSLVDKWIDFKLLSLHFDRIADIVHTNKDPFIQNACITDSQLTKHTAPMHGRLTLQDVGYAFSDLDTPIFNHINLEIPAGSTVAIIGPSGSGKTTLVKCMMGLYTTNQGQILIDGQAIGSVPNYRQAIAGVMQDDQLLNGSIAQNIACFSRQIDMQKVVYCSNLACIHDEIMNTNMQYNTLVGDMGSNLSGGQKQRIILARALYKEPAILFMDEATSHLDINSELAINNHISKLSITRVIIAHRPQTIEIADCIWKLENGCLSDVTSTIKPVSKTTLI